uniref:Uncharacterized LOC110949059 n=1 Tax=Acanthochromis polyacanthus TaxID=80966 RepID=A0A3Q1GR91_9TELE
MPIQWQGINIRCVLFDQERLDLKNNGFCFYFCLLLQCSQSWQDVSKSQTVININTCLKVVWFLLFALSGYISYFALGKTVRMPKQKLESVFSCPSVFLVSMSPYLKQIFTGDLFYLTCNASGNTVKWYKDGVEQQMWADGTVRIAVTSPKDSGIYQCQINGPKSDPVHIKVQDYVPTASLSINTGQPVMKTGDSVVLKIENEDGLQGWNCWVNRGEKTNKVKLKLKNDTVSLNFQTTNLTVPETIYWCTDNTGCRTNQITLRTSDKQVSLEMYPQSAVVGQSLTLRCLAWGTDQISHTVFYKGDSVVKKGGSSTYEISPVSDDTEGTYKCHATFTHVARTSGPPYSVLSDHQDVLIQKRPVTAVLSEDMVCSCQSCPGNWSERYYKKHDQSWVRLSSKPSGAGTFSCRAVGARMRTSLSASIHVPHPNPSGILIIILIVGLVALIVAAVAYIWHKRRNATGE